ncbi:MAG: endoribonuclease MazF [Candidatus Magnetomorum sp.]|nr:endoribonuclease MazF [Candidatus Magnetomorum sp.]
MSAYTPNRGDIVWINFNPQAGHEQAGRRPALILSPKNYNSKTGLAILCPITSKNKGYPFEVQIIESLPVSGVVLSDQVKSMDWRIRDTNFICKLDKSSVEKVLQRLHTLL